MGMSLRGVAVLVNVVEQVGRGRSVHAPISLEKASSGVSRLRQHQRADPLQHDHAINREVSSECGLLNINPSLP